MGNILVIAFEDQNEAGRVAMTLKKLGKVEAVHIEDMRIVVRDNNGELKIKDEAGHPVAEMAAFGGILGVILLVSFPVLGLVAGAGIAASMTVLAKVDLDRKFIDQVAETLQPGGAELFVLGNALDTTALLSALKPYKGTIIQTTISTENEELLKQALSEREG